MNAKYKKSLFALGVIGFTVGLLWSVRSDSSELPFEQTPRQNTISEEESQANSKPFWSQLNLKSSIQKRDEARAARQYELAQMINRIQGVSNASVLLSDNEVVGIGMPKQPMTACVLVDPIQGYLPIGTVDAIRKLVSGATAGLSSDQVIVIDNTSGVEVNSSLTSRPNVDAINEKVVQALGLNVATVTVTASPLSEFERAIPWLATPPTVRVTLPSSWLEKRGLQVGGQEVVLDSLRALIATVTPGSKATFQIVQDSPIANAKTETKESYTKLIAIVIGLGAIFISGFVVNYRRRIDEPMTVMQSVNPTEEARRILEMEHLDAKKTIDNMYGAFKVSVLREIVDFEDVDEEVPLVQVQTQCELELA
jgi:hypothetical protein